MVLAHPLEYEVEKQCYGCRVYDLGPFRPFGMLAASAVRYKFMPITGVQIEIYVFKYGLRTASVGITAPDFERYPYMRQLMGAA